MSTDKFPDEISFDDFTEKYGLWAGLGIALVGWAFVPLLSALVLLLGIAWALYWCWLRFKRDSDPIIPLIVSVVTLSVSIQYLVSPDETIYVTCAECHEVILEK